MTICTIPTSKSVFFSNSFDPILFRFFRQLTSEIAEQLMKFRKPLSGKDLCGNCKLLSAEHLTDLKHILDVYKQMIVDAEPQTQEAELLQTEDCVKKSTDIKDPMCFLSSERKLNDGILRGSYIVGGSVLGSNFITYGGGEPVYYGITKESYLSRQIKSLR